MSDLAEVLAAFRDSTGCDAAVWLSEERDGATRQEAVACPTGGLVGWTPPLSGGSPELVDSPDGPTVIGPIPGPRRAWLAVGPCATPGVPLEGFHKFLLSVVSQYLQSELEVEHAANELAERYEEINLLYTISEILGRTVSLEEAAATILKEVSETVGARRASLLVHDRVTDTLQAVAALGVAPADLPPIATLDECSVSARVFREHRAAIVEDGVDLCDAEAGHRRGAMLSVPIMWTAPAGAGAPLGVVNLSDRRSAQPFTAGDQKLMTAIATQIGTAIQNARLVRASLNQQSLVREMELAHDLQMRLLPRAETVAPEAEVAARVVPAESVGGDFYNLFRLGGGRTGVMLGDVSSHGYRAALIMALAMSASAIHAQASSDPGEMLSALLASLQDELSSTEMFITAFYAVIDRDAGILRYANAGLPHAYVVSRDGIARRLGALDPPLGMGDSPPSARSQRWNRGADVLLLFTDGVSDARDRQGGRFGEKRLLSAVTAIRAESSGVILQRAFEALAEHTGDTAQPDDLTLIVLRS